jgi:hypothetical protein
LDVDHAERRAERQRSVWRRRRRGSPVP